MIASAPLIGRGAELTALMPLLDPEPAGFEAAVIDGAAGIGKTTLWEHAVRAAGERSWRVLSTRAVEAEARLTYVALGDLLGELAEDELEVLPPPQRDAVAGALLRVDPEGGALVPRAVAAGVLSLLRRLARAAPVLIAVDDVHWLDPPSASVLGFVARRLDAEPVRLLLTQRPDEAGPFPLERMHPRLQRIELGPLSLGALHELIRRRTGTPLPRRRLIEIERLSGGNPLFALELVRTSKTHDPPTLPPRVGQAFVARIAALAPATQDELLVAALSARPPRELVDPRAVTDAQTADVVRLAADGTVCFTHPLLAWASLSLASGARLRAAHLRLASRTTDRAERLRHLALAAVGPDSALAAELEDAAAAAVGRDAPAAAAELLALARRLTPEDAHDDWARLAAKEAPLLSMSGDFNGAWALGQEALDRLPPGRGRALVLLEAAARHPGATELCLRAIQETEGDQTLTGRAHVSLAQQLLYAFEADQALEQADLAVMLARSIGEQSQLITATTMRGAVLLTTGAGDPLPDLEEAIELERRLGGSPVPLVTSATTYRALWQSLNDELDEARSTFEAQLELAIATGAERSKTQLRAVLGRLDARAGNWVEARGHYDAAIALADLMGFEQARGEQRARVAELQARAGAFDEARATLAEAAAICTPICDRLTLLLVLSVHLFIDVALDDPATGLDHLEQIRLLVPRGSPVPPWLEFRGDELAVLVAAGRGHAVEQELAALRREEVRTPRLRARIWIAHGTSLLLAFEGRHADALAVLESLLAETDFSRAPFEEARTFLLKGQLERRSKHKALARGSFDHAAELFARLGAEGWVAKAGAEIRRLGLRRPREELSETERRVVELAVSGKSNREIASTLFISRRTVESNLARVYRKLGVASRAELAFRIGSAGRNAE